MEYLELLGRIQLQLRPRTYVEVGVGQGASFAKVLPKTRAVGIDPILHTLSPRNRDAKFFPMPSDDFFARYDLTEELGAPVDLAFIDGMHLFEYALRDFISIEPCCTTESVILVHDCYPLSRETAARNRTTECWSGDIWKLILCLKRYRPELEISVVDVRPTGLGIVMCLDPASTVLSSRYDEICNHYVDLDYSTLDEAKDVQLNRVPNDWDLVRSFFELNLKKQRS
jgi:hypothetical protein